MRLFEYVQASDGPVIVDSDHSGALAELRDALKVSSLVAVPVKEGPDVVTGCLMVLDRVGAGEFGEDDGRLLEALANELVLTLDSYRLLQEVLEERERFGRIFAGSQEGICLVDDDGVVRAWNPALESITGYSSREVIGQDWTDVITIRDADQKRVDGLYLASAPHEEEFEVITRDGPARWISVLSGPVAEGGGRVVIVRDVSTKHEVEKAKTDFLSTISHELRTPLTTIKGSLQILERGAAQMTPELADQMVGVTMRGAERLERLVMNLLIVSQIEAGTIPLFLGEVSLQEIVEERRGVVLRDHLNTETIAPEADIYVRADRERTSQIVENLLENALKFGGPSGKITIEMSRANGVGHLSVSDQGPGIPRGDRERIFDRFVRLGDVLTRETQGAGVGLFIAKRAAEGMGGRIWVEGDQGRGATFHVEIPLAQPVALAETSA